MLCSSYLFRVILGEATLEYNFVRIKLDWGGELYSPLNAFSTFAAMIGTIVLIGGASKILKLADAWLGFISAVCSAISRLILVRFFSRYHAKWRICFYF